MEKKEDEDEGRELARHPLLLLLYPRRIKCLATINTSKEGRAEIGFELRGTALLQLYISQSTSARALCVRAQDRFPNGQQHRRRWTKPKGTSQSDRGEEQQPKTIRR